MLYSDLLSVLPNNNIYSGVIVSPPRPPTWGVSVSEMVVTKCAIVKAGHSR